MVRHTRMLVTVLWACIGPACGGASAPDSNSGAASSTTSSIVYAAASGTQFEWRVVEAASGQHMTIATTGAAPTGLFVDDTTHALTYREGDELWQVDWTTPSRPRSLGRVPAVPGQLVAFWTDVNSGRLRALEMRVRPPEEVRGPIEPPDGIPYYAIIHELDSNAWRELRRIDTTWEADGTPGYHVADDERRERGSSALSVLEASTCRSSLCDEEPDAELRARIGTIPADTQADEWRWLSLPEVKRDLVFGVAFGDTYHPVPPLFLLAADRTSIRLAANRNEPLRIAQRGRYLLVTSEAEGANPEVIDAETGKVTFTGSGTSAMWLPGRHP
jgi:hypothetical protein